MEKYVHGRKSGGPQDNFERRWRMEDAYVY